MRARILGVRGHVGAIAVLGRRSATHRKNVWRVVCSKPNWWARIEYCRIAVIVLVAIVVCVVGRALIRALVGHVGQRDRAVIHVVSSIASHCVTFRLNSKGNSENRQLLQAISIQSRCILFD